MASTLRASAPEIFIRSPLTWLFWALTALAVYVIIANLRRSWRMPSAAG